MYCCYKHGGSDDVTPDIFKKTMDEWQETAKEVLVEAGFCECGRTEKDMAKAWIDDYKVARCPCCSLKW